MVRRREDELRQIPRVLRVDGVAAPRLLLREPVQGRGVVHLAEVLFSRIEEAKNVLVRPVSIGNLAVELDGLGVPGAPFRFALRFPSLVEALRALLALLLGAERERDPRADRVVEGVERRDQQR